VAIESRSKELEKKLKDLATKCKITESEKPKVVTKTRKEIMQKFLKAFDYSIPREVLKYNNKFAIKARNFLLRSKPYRSYYLHRFRLNLRRAIAYNVIQKYAEEKYRHYIRKRNINSFLIALRAAILVKGDMLQTVVNDNFKKMGKHVNNMLFPIQFLLSHKKTFTAEEGLYLTLEGRAKFTQQFLSSLRDDLKMFENEVMPLVRKKEDVSKEKLTKVYNVLLGKLADLEEYEKLLRVDIHLKNRPLINMKAASIPIIFDVQAKTRIPITMLLDFKEYCDSQRYYNASREVDKVLLDIGVLI